jgi:hypothetical protein
MTKNEICNEFGESYIHKSHAREQIEKRKINIIKNCKNVKIKYFQLVLLDDILNNELK